MNQPTNSTEGNISARFAKFGIPDPTQRWNIGYAHREDAEKLAREIAAIDYLYAGDSFEFKFGGDGDNGELLTYCIDMLLDLQDAEQREQEPAK